MGKKTVLVATILVSFLAIGAAPARADQPHRNGFQGRSEADRLGALSHRLEGSVRHLQRVAERRFAKGSRRDRRALRALQILGRRASRFHARVERHPGAVRHLIADFRALDESLRVADKRIQRVRSRRLRQQLGRIGTLVQEVDRELHRRTRLARNPGPRGRRNREFAWHW